uniref:Uncharacterized protein n=1 Tax=Panagrolaimus superbus TaxID=310955 RepID=A0A914ZB49_9BILA
MKDESKVGKQNGRNVVLNGFSENINLTLKDSTLTFKLCTPCSGTIQICYDSISPNSNLQGSCDPSQCELKINIKKTAVTFNSDTSQMDVGTICDYLRIQNTETKFNTISAIQTCPPKIVDGIIHLFVTKAECQVEVVCF